MKQDDVRIATPCTLDWKKMKPTQGGRFCGDCKKVVRDLSGMTEAEARELLDAAPPELCVRFIYDNQGRVFFRDAQRIQENILHPANLLSRAKRAAATVALAAVPLATAACDVLGAPLGLSSSASTENEELQPEYHEMMGGAMPGPSDVPLQPNDVDGGADGAAEASTDNNADGGDAGDGDGGGVSIYQ